MSSQSLIDQIQRNFNSVKRDVKSREDQARKGEQTFFIDSQIKGQFSDLNSLIQELERMVNENNGTMREQEKQKKQYSEVLKQRDNLKKWYDGFFQVKSAAVSQYSGGGDNETDFHKKYDTQGLNSKQLNQLRTHQINQQDQLVDNLLGVADNILVGGKAVGKELDEQKGMLNQLAGQVDDNTGRMNRTRGKMLRLLEESSNKVLMLIILLEIVGVILIFTIWK